MSKLVNDHKVKEQPIFTLNTLLKDRRDYHITWYARKYPH